MQSREGQFDSSVMLP
nr:unnamed protein product [Callosobruchus chinensis]